jgi:hypothetical protein
MPVPLRAIFTYNKSYRLGVGASALYKVERQSEELAQRITDLVQRFPCSLVLIKTTSRDTLCVALLV